ncbi:hypothetical protein [Streptomyces sp. NPDC007205]|uniref:hypothetical protein n=1 Tax=Streptomyces sp. NPDC007205 TaxID=3154316 RepID=UPI00340560E3
MDLLFDAVRVLGAQDQTGAALADAAGGGVRCPTPTSSPLTAVWATLPAARRELTVRLPAAWAARGDAPEPGWGRER